MRAKPTLVPAVPVELPDDLVSEANACVRGGADAGRCTLGDGEVEHLPVVGTQHRGPAVDTALSASGGYAANAQAPAAAVLLRDPRNPHDSNAVKVLVAGVHVGYLPAAAAQRYQPLLKECENRGQVLVARLRFLPPRDGYGTGAALDVRTSLVGWSRSVALPPPFVVETLPPALLAGDELAAIVERVKRLADQEETRRKQVAGVVVKRVRELLPALVAHAAALEQIDEQRAERLHDLLDQVEADADDLLEAEDADEREDAHTSLLASLEEVPALL